MQHYGCETNKHHLFWAGLAPPHKTRKYFCKEDKTPTGVFCALKYCTIKRVVTKISFITHSNKQRINRVSLIVLGSKGIERMRSQNSLHRETARHK